MFLSLNALESNLSTIVVLGAYDEFDVFDHLARRLMSRPVGFLTPRTAITGQFAPRAPEHLERLLRSCWVLAFRAAAGEWESPVLRLIVVHHFRWWASWRAVVEGAEDSVLSLDYFVAFVGSCFAQVVDVDIDFWGGEVCPVDDVVLAFPRRFAADFAVPLVRVLDVCGEFHAEPLSPCIDFSGVSSNFRRDDGTKFDFGSFVGFRAVCECV